MSISLYSEVLYDLVRARMMNDVQWAADADPAAATMMRVCIESTKSCPVPRSSSHTCTLILTPFCVITGPQTQTLNRCRKYDTITITVRYECGTTIVHVSYENVTITSHNI